MNKYIKIIISHKQSILLLVFLGFMFILFKPAPMNINQDPSSSLPKEDATTNEEYANSSNMDSENSKSSATDQKKETSYIYIDLRGAVKKPDIYKINSTMRLNDLIIQAGGLDSANEDCINLAQSLTDGTRIDIPFAGESCDSNQSTSALASPATNSATSSGEPTEIVNINTATAEQLQTLSGIGEGKANQIISYREENGPFKKIEDIMNVSGIGESSFAKIKDSICI